MTSSGCLSSGTETVDRVCQGGFNETGYVVEQADPSVKPSVCGARLKFSAFAESISLSSL